MPQALEHVLPFLSTAVILGILIFVHELGHFLACRISGVGVEKFSIGFGPEILAWQGRETRYSISWIPFGGFVKPQGESFDVVVKRGRLDARDYLAASIPKRLLILVAGVAMNYLLAYVLFVWMMTMGHPVLSTTLGALKQGYPAEISGLHIGDQVTALNGLPVSDWQDLTMKIMQTNGEELQFTVRRDGVEEIIRVMPKLEDGQDLFGQSKKVPKIGILPSDQYSIERFEFEVALQKAWEIEWRLTALTHEALWRLVTGQLSLKTVSGPIGIMALAGSAAKVGLPALLQLMAVLSVSLAVINLLPIPALDGGHVFFLLAEFIFRKPVSPAVQDRVTQFGFYFLMALMVLVVYNDLVNVGVFEKIKTAWNTLQPVSR